MPDVFDEVTDKINQAAANTSGMPFPERLEDMVFESAGEVVWWLVDLVVTSDGPDLFNDADANAGPSDPPSFEPSLPTPPDPADGGAPPGGGLTAPPGDDDDDDDDD